MKRIKNWNYGLVTMFMGKSLRINRIKQIKKGRFAVRPFFILIKAKLFAYQNNERAGRTGT